MLDLITTITDIQNFPWFFYQVFRLNYQFSLRSLIYLKSLFRIHQETVWLWSSNYRFVQCYTQELSKRNAVCHLSYLVLGSSVRFKCTENRLSSNRCIDHLLYKFTQSRKEKLMFMFVKTCIVVYHIRYNCALNLD